MDATIQFEHANVTISIDFIAWRCLPRAKLLVLHQLLSFSIKIHTDIANIECVTMKSLRKRRKVPSFKSLIYKTYLHILDCFDPSSLFVLLYLLFVHSLMFVIFKQTNRLCIISISHCCRLMLNLLSHHLTKPFLTFTRCLRHFFRIAVDELLADPSIHPPILPLVCDIILEGVPTLFLNKLAVHNTRQTSLSRSIRQRSQNQGVSLKRARLFTLRQVMTVSPKGGYVRIDHLRYLLASSSSSFGGLVKQERQLLALT